jgi:hypothetical protein
MLVVPVGVCLQQPAGDEIEGEAPLFQPVGLGDRERGRVGELQQQGADLGADEFAVRQCGGDQVEPPAFALAVEREPIALGEFTVELAPIAPCPGASRVTRE